MASTRPHFRGTIDAIISSNHQKKWSIPFEFGPTLAPSFPQTLMSSFQDLGLAPEEKRALSFQYREELFCYRNLDFQEVEPYVQKLIAKLNKKGTKKIFLTASDMGAFICLAAVYSGQIRSDVQLSIELSDLPLKLFPKNWVKHPSISKNISIELAPSTTWIGHIKSLTECPDYLSLKSRTKKGAHSSRKVA